MSNRQLLADIQRRQRELRMQAINPDKVSEVLRIKESYVKYENLQAFEKAVTKILADMEAEIELIRSRADSLVEDAKDRIEETLDEVKETTEKQVDSSVGSILDDRIDAVREDTEKALKKAKEDVATLLENVETRLLSKMRALESMDDETETKINSSIKKLSDNLNSLKGQSKQQIAQTKESISGNVLSIQKALEDRIKSLENDLFNSMDDIETLKKQPAGSIPKGLIEKINSFVVQRSVNIPVTTDQGGLGTSIKPTTGQVPVGNADGTYSPGTISGSAHIIQDEGVSLTSRSKLNFVGSGVTATDDAVNDATVLTITSGSGITRSITVTSGNVSAGSTASTDYVYLVAGAHTVTLPTAVSNTNRYTVKNNHSANITVDTSLAQTIDGSTSISVAPQEAVDIISTNTNWSII